MVPSATTHPPIAGTNTHVASTGASARWWTTDTGPATGRSVIARTYRAVVGVVSAIDPSGVTTPPANSATNESANAATVIVMTPATAARARPSAATTHHAPAAAATAAITAGNTNACHVTSETPKTPGRSALGRALSTSIQ